MNTIAIKVNNTKSSFDYAFSYNNNLISTFSVNTIFIKDVPFEKIIDSIIEICSIFNIIDKPEYTTEIIKDVVFNNKTYDVKEYIFKTGKSFQCLRTCSTTDLKSFLIELSLILNIEFEVFDCVNKKRVED